MLLKILCSTINQNELIRGFDTSGFMAVNNIDTNEIIHVSVEEFKINKNYTSVLAGSISVRDTRDNTTKRVSVNDFNLYEYYI